MNFWIKIEQPILALAPMDDVTDIAFRQMFARYGRRGSIVKKLLGKLQNPVLFTEFVSSDGLVLADERGKKKLLKKLEFKSNERPIVAQIFGSNPENMAQAAQLVEKLGFDGVDINMGCPDKSVEKTGSGSAMILNKNNAKEIILAVQNATNLPVSVKTRLGYDKFDIDWIKFLLSLNLNALTVHLRTRNELSKVSAHWELAKEIKEMKAKISPDTVLLFNGDIQSEEEALRLCRDNELDGVMIGRGAFGNPLFFTGQIITKEDKIHLLIKHLQLFDKYLIGIKSFSVMKKHFKAYIEGFEDAKSLRGKLMNTESPGEAINLLKQSY